MNQKLKQTTVNNLVILADETKFLLNEFKKNDFDICKINLNDYFKILNSIHLIKTLSVIIESDIKIDVNIDNSIEIFNQKIQKNEFSNIDITISGINDTI